MLLLWFWIICGAFNLFIYSSVTEDKLLNIDKNEHASEETKNVMKKLLKENSAGNILWMLYITAVIYGPIHTYSIIKDFIKFMRK